jgi:hypothetical protein
MSVFVGKTGRIGLYKKELSNYSLIISRWDKFGLKKEKQESKVDKNRLMVGKKTGGRVAGTPNKVTSELRKTLKGVIANELEQLPVTLEGLPARERLELVIKLLPFCLPKVDKVSGSYDSGWDVLGDN